MRSQQGPASLGRPGVRASFLAGLLALVLPAGASAEVIYSTVTVWELLPTALGPFSMDREIVDLRTLDDAEGGMAEATADFGSGGYARGFLTEDGITYGDIVQAPNQNRRLIEPVLGRGGVVEVEVRHLLRRTEELASVRYIFSGFTVTVGYDPEFGPRCPPGEFSCMDAGWSSTARLYKIGSAEDPEVLLAEQAFEARVGTDFSNGFEAYGEVPGSFLLDVVDGPYGASITTPQPEIPQPGTQNAGFASLPLDGIEIDEVFAVYFTLTAWAYDGGSDVGLGRKAFAFVRDPLDAGSGVTLEFTGIESAAVPLPASAWLLATAVLAALRGRRRR
jgi:hypothetical protein